MIKLEVLNAVRGEAKIFIEEEKEEERVKLADQVQKMKKSGHAVFLCESGVASSGAESKKTTYRIQDYDPKTNEWIVRLKAKKQKRQPAKSSSAIAVAPSAGG